MIDATNDISRIGFGVAKQNFTSQKCQRFAQFPNIQIYKNEEHLIMYIKGGFIIKILSKIFLIVIIMHHQTVNMWGKLLAVRSFKIQTPNQSFQIWPNNTLCCSYKRKANSEGASARTHAFFPTVDVDWFLPVLFPVVTFHIFVLLLLLTSFLLLFIGGFFRLNIQNRLTLLSLSFFYPSFVLLTHTVVFIP